MDPLDKLGDLNLRSKLVGKPKQSQRKQQSKRRAEQPIDYDDETDSLLHPLDALKRANTRDRRQAADADAVRPRVPPAATDPSTSMEQDVEEEGGQSPFNGSPMSGAAAGFNADTDEPRVGQQQAAQAGLEPPDADTDEFVHPLDQLADGKDHISAGMALCCYGLLHVVVTHAFPCRHGERCRDQEGST